MANYAFVTLVTSDNYLPGALAVVAALKEVHPHPPLPPEVPFQTVCIVSPETVDINTIKHLRRAFDVVIGVEVIEGQQSQELQLLGRPDLHSVLTKLHVFRLTQYDKIIFLDADVLPIRPLSHLFTLPHEFSAVPDVGWPDIFNSGVMVLTPGQDKFSEIMEIVKSIGTWDGGDQGVLNEWRGDDWHRLSFTYNTTPTATYTYAPAYKRFGSKISAIHFIGPNKPWNQIPYRAPSSKVLQSTDTTTQNVTEGPTTSVVVAVPPESYGYSNMVDRWFDVYDRHYRRRDEAPPKEFRENRYESAWNDRSAPPSPGPSQGGQPRSGGGMGLEELRKMAIEGSGAAPSQGGIGEYRSMPLDGRVDLMRPPKPDPPPPQLRVEEQTPPEEGPSNQQQHPQSHQEHHEQRGEHHHHQEHQGQTPWTQHSPGQQGYSHQRSPQVSESYHTPQTHPPPSGQAFDRGSRHEGPHHERQGNASSESYHPQHGEHHQPSQPYPTHSSSSHEWRGHEPPSHHSSHHLSHHTPHHHQSHDHSSHPHQSHHGQPHHHHHHHHAPPPAPPSEPTRPPSPPLLSWNPAVEPPPNVPPPITNFPSTAYFPNAWDLSPSAGRLHTSLTGTTIPDTRSFFEPPPTRQIPQQLINEGTYANVMGHTPHQPQVSPPPVQHQHGQPSSSEQPREPEPEPVKIAKVFPWEEKPRHMPKRVFPGGEKPPPGTRYIEDMPPEPKPEPEPVPEPSKEDETPKAETRPKMHIDIPSSPPGTFPTSRAYSNAWDAVPSIQKYAAKLVKPPPVQSHPVFIAPPGMRRRSDSYRSRGEQSDANSMDGDVEDEVDDDDEARAAGGGRFSSSEREDVEGGGRGGRSRSGSKAKTPKKEYRSYGVQTVPKDVRSVGVQVSLTSSSTQTGRRDEHAAPAPSGFGSNGSSGSGNSKRGVNSPRIRSRRASTATVTAAAATTSPQVAQRSSSTGTQHHIDLPIRPNTVQELKLQTEQMAAASPSLVSAQAFIRPTRHNVTGVHGPSSHAPSGTMSPRMTDSPARTPAAQSPLASPPSVGNIPRMVPKQLSQISTSTTGSSTTVRPNAPGAGSTTAWPNIPLSVARASSTETAESPGPVSPADTFVSHPGVATSGAGYPAGSRKTSRQWNPATGLDVFKRGSEEVLARFLRMGSWEDESPTATTSAAGHSRATVT